jgi:hypothetical protein
MSYICWVVQHMVSSVFVADACVQTHEGSAHSLCQHLELQNQASCIRHIDNSYTQCGSHMDATYTDSMTMAIALRNAAQL